MYDARNKKTITKNKGVFIGSIGICLLSKVCVSENDGNQVPRKYEQYRQIYTPVQKNEGCKEFPSP